VLRRLVWLLVALLAPAALGAEERPMLVAQVLDAPGVPEAVTRRVHRSAETLLKKLSGLPVGEGPAFKPGPRRNCADVACQRAVVSAAGSPAVALLSLRSSKGGVAFDVSFWMEGEKLGLELGDAELEAPENGLKPALDAVLPAWAKRGWGALRLDAQPGAVVKLDGRPMKLKAGEMLSVPAGTHQLDVIYASGDAVLQRVEVPEGSRTRLDVTRPPVVVAAAAEGNAVLRAVSFGLWTAGAAAIAGSLVAGSLSRQTGVGQNPCSGDSRSCSTFDVATERHRQAQSYASTGNILLGTGLVLATAGAGVFVFDLVRTRPSGAAP
jgi:hypothetical protein